MPKSNMLTLALALRDSLVTELPALVSEINTAHFPDTPITVPSSVTLGTRVEMLKRELDELPALACGIYTRSPVREDEAQQEWSQILLPFIIDVYLGDTSADDLYVKSHKWALVLDLYIERYGSSLLFGYYTDEAPILEVSYCLEHRDGTFRQLISATGVFSSSE